MSVEQKLRVAYIIQVVCIAATAALVIAQVIAQAASVILMLVAVVLMTAAYVAPLLVRCPRCRKPVFFSKQIYLMGIPTGRYLFSLPEPERVCSQCGKILMR